MLNPCRVVNLYKEPFDIYIGWGRNPVTGVYDGHWGNPFIIGATYQNMIIDREMACDLYEEHICVPPTEGWEITRCRVVELMGKVLGCYCKPKRCHGDILAKLANKGRK